MNDAAQALLDRPGPEFNVEANGTWYRNIYEALGWSAEEAATMRARDSQMMALERAMAGKLKRVRHGKPRATVSCRPG